MTISQQEKQHHDDLLASETGTAGTKCDVCLSPKEQYGCGVSCKGPYIGVIKRYSNDAFQGADMQLSAYKDSRDNKIKYELIVYNEAGEIEYRKECPSTEAADAMAEAAWEYLAGTTCSKCGGAYDPGEPHAKDGECADCVNTPENQVQDRLIEALEQHAETNDERINCQSFEDASILTDDKGIILDVGGKRYQITIKRDNRA